jgi:kynureninase
MAELRERSLRLTRFLELLLDEMINTGIDDFNVITPRDPSARGAQISIRLKPNFLDPVLECLDENGVVIDERKPDVVRVAPAPLFNTFTDVWDFCKILKAACARAREKLTPEAVISGTDPKISRLPQ